MANGFFLGGLSDSLNQGFARNQQADFQQQELKIQQQGQQMAQQRFDMARIDKLLSDVGDHIQQTIDAGKVAGEDPKKIQTAIQGMADQYRQLATSAGYKGMADANMAAWFAAPPSTDVMKAQTEAKATPKVEKLQSAAGDQSLYVVDPFKGKATPVEGASTVPPDMTGLHGTQLRDTLAKRAGLTPDSLDINARALIDGNISVLTNLGRGKQGGEAVKAIRAYAADVMTNEYGMSPEQAAGELNANIADFTATKAGAVSLGRREAMVTGAATTAMATAPRVLEASKNVSKTNYPSLNAIVNIAKEGTGDQNVIRLGIAINTFVNNYARALGAGNAGVTNAARAEAWENLNKAWSQGQISAAVDQMLNKELPSELTGAKMGLREFIRQKTKGNAFAPGETVTGVDVQDGPKNAGKVPPPPPGFVITSP